MGEFQDQSALEVGFWKGLFSWLADSFSLPVFSLTFPPWRERERERELERERERERERASEIWPFFLFL